MAQISLMIPAYREVEGVKATSCKLIAHSKSRDEIYDEVTETKEKYAYLFYIGESPKKGYVGGGSANELRSIPCSPSL